jgi:hypothetical protein
LTGSKGNYSSYAIAQDDNSATSIVTAPAGLEVVASYGFVSMVGLNNVGKLAGDVRGGLAFDNGGRNLAVDSVNGRLGFSTTSTGALGLYNIGALTLNESFNASENSSISLYANEMAIAAGKLIGNSTGFVIVVLSPSARYHVNNITLSSRNISLGTTTAGKLAPMFINQDSSTFAFFRKVCFNGDPYTTLIQETRSGQTKSILRDKGHTAPYSGRRQK